MLGINPICFLAVFTIQFCLGALDASRIAQLLSLGPQHRLKNLNLAFKSALVAQLPTGILGGEIFRGTELASFGVPISRAAGAIIVNQLLGVAALCFLGSLVCGWLIVVNGVLTVEMSSALLWAGLVGSVCISGFSLGLSFYGTRLTQCIPLKKAQVWMATLETFAFAQIWKTFGLSILIAIFRILALLVLLKIMGIVVSPLVVATSIIAGGLLSMIPITISAIGLREAGIAGMLIVFGMDSGIAFSVAVLLRVCAIITVLLSFAALSFLIFAQIHFSGKRPNS